MNTWKNKDSSGSWGKEWRCSPNRKWICDGELFFDMRKIEKWSQGWIFYIFDESKSAIRMIQKHSVDEVLVVQNDFSQEEDPRDIRICQNLWGAVSIYRQFVWINEDEYGDFFSRENSVIEIKNIWLTPWGRVWKWIFDIVFSFVALICLSPLFLIVSFIIYSQDGHNPFYKSKRVCKKNGDLFDMYNGSMIMNAEKEKNKLLAKNERKDGPLFWIGKWSTSYGFLKMDTQIGLMNSHNSIMFS